MVTNEVYVSNSGLRRGLILYHYKNETELKSVQRFRIVNPVKEINGGSTTSRRSTFKRNFGKSQQEDVLEGTGKRKTRSHIIVFLSTPYSMFVNRF